MMVVMYARESGDVGFRRRASECIDRNVDASLKIPEVCCINGLLQTRLLCYQGVIIGIRVAELVGHVIELPQYIEFFLQCLPNVVSNIQSCHEEKSEELSTHRYFNSTDNIVVLFDVTILV